jgi:hypothetical protein
MKACRGKGQIGVFWVGSGVEEKGRIRRAA